VTTGGAMHGKKRQGGLPVNFLFGKKP
jgi:hypothetical protein